MTKKEQQQAQQVQEHAVIDEYLNLANFFKQFIERIIERKLAEQSVQTVKPPVERFVEPSDNQPAPSISLPAWAASLSQSTKPAPAEKNYQKTYNQIITENYSDFLALWKTGVNWSQIVMAASKQFDREINARSFQMEFAKIAQERGDMRKRLKQAKQNESI